MLELVEVSSCTRGLSHTGPLHHRRGSIGRTDGVRQYEQRRAAGAQEVRAQQRGLVRDLLLQGVQLRATAAAA